MSAEILQVEKPVRRQDDIVSHQYHTYAPYTTTFNSNDEIRITIQSQDLYIQPSESYLLIDFTIAAENGNPIAPNKILYVTYVQ